MGRGCIGGGPLAALVVCILALPGTIPMDDFQRELGRDLLASVSRSFYLSLKLMPGRVREAASLGYLLARATDTVADTEAVAPGRRLELLEEMLCAIVEGAEEPGFGDVAEGSDVSSGEALLLGKFGRCLEWLAALPESQRGSVRRVMGPIVKGQSDDLRRFAGVGAASLGSAEELEQYTFDVAGCVGVFWTEIGFDAYGSSFASRPREEMEQLGERFGKGLQLLNILRDLPDDLSTGRCYLPGGDANIGGSSIWDELAELWLARCRELLSAAPTYVDALRNRRIRLATALPALIAGKTLNLLEQANWEQLENRVKVPRAEVKRLMAKAVLVSPSRRGLGKMCRASLGTA